MATPSKRPFVRGFAADAPTERALRAGLAGRDIQIQRGRLPAALRTLAAEPSSSLVFVDLDGVSEPEAAAKQLTGICAFETSVVAIGSTDTAQYGRVLLQHGISDYLVKPVTSAAIREAASTLTGGVSEHLYAGRVVAFAGSAGSGRATLVAALARGIAEEGRTATVVDMDPIGGRLPALLDTEPRGGLTSLLAPSGADSGDDHEPQVDPRRIDEVATPAAQGISLLAYVPDGSLPARPALPLLSALFGQLANRTHVVLATGFADPAAQIDMLRQADDRMLLYEPSLASIGAAAKAKLRELRGRGIRDVAFVASGTRANTISLGLYRSAKNASRRVAQLRKLGYPAESTANEATIGEYAVRARIDGARSALEAAWSTKFAGNPVRYVNCP